MHGYPLLRKDPLLKGRPSLNQRTPVTVCIAAICNNNSIWGASDRMLTSGDGEVEFEPTFPKSINLTNSIVAMMAGDSAIQAEVLQDVMKLVHDALGDNPTYWFKVKDAAQLWADVYTRIRLKRAETAILAALGLTQASFLTTQKTMDSQLVAQLSAELVNFHLSEFDTIITGIDERPHIYAVDNTSLHCFDTVGFAAIGSGARHARSQFMLARHGRASDIEETLLLTYSSKKFSEVAPGVGKATDLFGIGPGPGSCFSVNDEVLNELDKMHCRRVKREQVAMKKAIKEIHEYTKKLNSEAANKIPETQQAKEIAGGAPPADGTSVPVDPKKN
jgi:hypothetical protein